MAQYSYTPLGVPVREVTSHESYINIHPDHTGLIIGSRGSTIQKIQRDTGVDVLRIRKPNKMSGGMPWIQIRGHLKSVENAYQRVMTIAHEADRRIPRMNSHTSMSVPAPPPSVAHTAFNMQHPFGSNTKPQPPPLQMPHPSVVGETLGFASSGAMVSASGSDIQEYVPQSPEYCPNSPSYCPSSPVIDGPQSPPGSPPPVPKRERKKVKFVKKPQTDTPLYMNVLMPNAH